MSYDNLKIVGLKAQNVMRLKLVEFSPKTDAIIVGGENGEGKSSLLTSILMVLGGGKEIPDEPVRKGQNAAIVVADLGDIICTLHMKPDGAKALEVKTKEGARLSSPQKVLDELLGKVTFDPIRFLNHKPEDQLAILKEMVGLDFSDLELRKANAYGKRTDANKEIQQLTARIEALNICEPDPGFPTEEESVVDLTRKVMNAERFDEDLNDLESRGHEANSLVDETKATLERLMKQIEEEKGKLAGYEKRQAELRDQYRVKLGQKKSLKSEEMRSQLDNLIDTNRKIRLANQYRDLQGQLKAATDNKASLEKELGDVEVEREKRLTAAKFPIPDLSFDDKGIRYKGTPFEQASSAQRLRTSVAMGIALNPKIRVMVIRDGAYLDKGNLEVIKDMATENNMQIWIEVVGDRDECTVVMDEGELIVKPEKPEKPKLKGPKVKA